MVLAVTAASVYLGYAHVIGRGMLLTLIPGGLAVAVIGFLDDRYKVPAKVRFLVHLGAAVWAVYCLEAPAEMRLGHQLIYLGPWGGGVLAVLTITWAINLFNFMDGIDGIAASETAFMSLAGAALVLLGEGPTAVAIVLGAASCGFLLWNWPPARIFMGDVGSGYLGYVVGVLIIAAMRDNANSLWSWLILGLVFFVDATVTLLRRLIRGDRVYQAHRSHAYQWLARRWGSHLKVTTAVLVVNLVWLLPAAWLAVRNPIEAPWITALVLAPLVLLVVFIGAGRREAVPESDGSRSGLTK